MKKDEHRTHWRWWWLMVHGMKIRNVSSFNVWTNDTQTKSGIHLIHCMWDRRWKVMIMMKKYKILCKNPNTHHLPLYALPTIPLIIDYRKACRGHVSIIHYYKRIPFPLSWNHLFNVFMLYVVLLFTSNGIFCNLKYIIWKWLSDFVSF